MMSIFLSVFQAEAKKPTDLVKNIFLESADVKARQKEFISLKLQIDKTVDKALIKTSCGFVGCYKTFFVTQTATDESAANVQTRVIAAIVTLGPGDPGLNKVKVIDQAVIESLTK